MAGLFLLLHAFFLAAVQVLVYAGAVIVLFLFVIMLLDLKEEAMRQVKLVMGALGLLSVGAIAVMMVRTIVFAHPAGRMAKEPLEGSTVALGQVLFTRFSLPFELISLLLLVAMVGVILLSRKDLR
jgi:NADH-quinone oxidoreductase subunit J